MSIPNAGRHECQSFASRLPLCVTASWRQDSRLTQGKDELEVERHDVFLLTCISLEAACLLPACLCGMRISGLACTQSCLKAFLTSTITRHDAGWPDTFWNKSIAPYWHSEFLYRTHISTMVRNSGKFGKPKRGGAKR